MRKLSLGLESKYTWRFLYGSVVQNKDIFHGFYRDKEANSWCFFVAACKSLTVWIFRVEVVAKSVKFLPSLPALFPDHGSLRPALTIRNAQFGRRRRRWRRWSLDVSPEPTTKRTETRSDGHERDTPRGGSTFNVMKCSFDRSCRTFSSSTWATVVSTARPPQVNDSRNQQSETERRKENIAAKKEAAAVTFQ